MGNEVEQGEGGLDDRKPQSMRGEAGGLGEGKRNPFI